MHRTSQAVGQRNIEAKRHINKLTYFYHLLTFFVAISGYNVLFNSEIIRKPGTMVTHIGKILGEYRIANIGKHQLDNIGKISVYQLYVGEYCNKILIFNSLAI